MSDSKFGVFGNLQKTQEERNAAKAENNKNIKAEKQKIPQEEAASAEAPKVKLRHYSSYMPADLYHEMQAHVLKMKGEREKGQEKPSVQAFITAAVRAYLDQQK